MKQPAIELQNVTVRYDDKVAIQDATFMLDRGVICGLVGMNGAGKSTLFKAIMGFVTPTSGTVRINGMPVHQAQKQEIISYVPQAEDVDWNFPVSVWDVVMMGRYGYMNIFRTPSPEDIEAVQDALDKVKMLAFKNRQIGELSGGQRKRVFLARSLAQKASIMLLDEPFAGVDAKTESEMTALLMELKQKGATILISTHELTALTEYCDQVVLVKQSIIAAGKTEKVFTPDNVARTFEGMIHRLSFGTKPVDINH